LTVYVHAAAVCCLSASNQIVVGASLLKDIFRFINRCFDYEQLRQVTLLLNGLLDENCTYYCLLLWVTLSFHNTKVLHRSFTPNLKSNCWTLV